MKVPWKNKRAWIDSELREDGFVDPKSVECMPAQEVYRLTVFSTVDADGCPHSNNPLASQPWVLPYLPH